MFKSEKIAEVNGNDTYARELENFQAGFHVHPDTDEMFLVLSGQLFVDLENGTIKLTAGQAYTVRSGVKHRTRVKERTKAIVISKGLAA